MLWSKVSQSDLKKSKDTKSLDAVRLARARKRGLGNPRRALNFGDEISVQKMTTFYSHILTCTATSTTPILVNVSSGFAPFTDSPLSSSQQPLYFSQMNELYDYYFVKKCKTTFYVAIQSTTVGASVWCNLTESEAVMSSLQTAVSLPGPRKLVTQGGPGAVLSKVYNPVRYWGDKPENNQDLWSATTASPGFAAEVKHRLAVNNSSSGTILVTCVVTVDMEIAFIGRNNPVP